MAGVGHVRGARFLSPSSGGCVGFVEILMSQPLGEAVAVC